MKPASGLQRLLSKDEFLAVGLMSGTSMDGIDAALVQMDAGLEQSNIELVAFKTRPYPEELKDNLMELATGQECTAEDIALLQTSVAVGFANCFFELMRTAGMDSEDVDFIGSHGQTVAHAPPSSGRGHEIAGTLQLGPPGMIAALTGITTVGDFRVGDIALGGQGAPLSPYADYLLRRSENVNRIILNIGGIANLTYLPRNCKREAVIAFDTGPGNMVLDALFRALYPTKGSYDQAGENARRGEPSKELVDKFLTHPYFENAPPKTSGHREFGTPFAWEFLSQGKERGLKREDILASAASLTARSIAGAIEEFVQPRGEVDEVYLSGGGARNKAITNELEALLEPVQVRPIDDLGIPAEAKEAVDFAVLARETLLVRKNVISSATGASKETILGTIALGSDL
ncbi:MAG: anhydro-N-acetylmuramic acid kinase [Candidatus Latescibacteria bacterium]|nr:anhydro-N-acetylmuramic acid kinase [Candidatus Latescibacterota bacterium]NIM22219.1 anhydro-N-acetylmuramic acid kinase [Candidatus Latescibacterota bacterium]NIM66258.1 anhydro-N-acetylmuramic acid kinase [Candidatus Latescibacterota bacterium]NIO02335.1 anhydro-N-acetylmuramic acid kinase [Candidatus Latescibacterota bacterium]NIO29866.1 anhydro-N-acetylmuramic acid kinase [Candidatus Latescibacterota bacterium]